MYERERMQEISLGDTGSFQKIANEKYDDEAEQTQQLQ